MKILFAIFGFFLFGSNLIGALLGWFAGSFFERYVNYGAGGVNPLTERQRSETFKKTLFQLAGRVAKADGKVSQDEIDVVEQIIRQMGMTGDSRQQSIAYFRQGTKEGFDVDLCLQSFIQVCGRTRSLKQTLLTYLVSLAYADDKLDRNERALLERIFYRLGIGQMQFDAFLRMYENQQRFSQSGYSYNGQGGTGSSGTNYQNVLQEAYQALGVQPSASDQEVKKAYRKLMSQNHPDKLAGQGVPADMLKVATEKSKAIQAAYDVIKKSRQK